MAKQRKQKQKDANRAPTPTADSNRPYDGSCVTVREQKLCVAIDVAEQRIHGYTELKVVAPKNGVIGLHARGLHIVQVWVDGVRAQFELLRQPSGKHQFQNGGYTVTTVSDAADACYKKYVAALNEEMIPELLIHPGEDSTPLEASQDPSSLSQVVAEVSKLNGGAQSCTPVEAIPEGVNATAVAPVQEHCNLVRVEYWVEKPLAGAHFRGKVFHTNSQLRRTRCWFPCVDSTTDRCSYSLEITVASENIAVSNGKLLFQVYSKEGPHLKTYAYSMSIPITANYISLVVAPLVVLPDRSNVTISHLCMPGEASRLQCTVNFFHLLFSTYEEYLGAPFPFGCYKQVFIDSDSTISSVCIGASMVTLSSHLLVDERIIDQAFSTQVKLAHALAQQWFGVFITPDSPADAWLLEGLAGFLCDSFVKRYMGNNEARYRRFKANEAVCMVDVGDAPVLSWQSVAGTDLYGTEKLGALGQIRAWKATAVVQMLEKQMGPEPFKKILQRIILRAQDPVRHLRTLSTKEFRHFANKLGNLERPFLKEFFPRWVESSGCPRLRMAFLYSKRRNMVELAVHRESTSSSGPSTADKISGTKLVTADLGWPGMMSIRIHELDGMYDHPSLPMAGDTYQLLEIQCHSKLAGRRIPKAKKGSKPDVAEDNLDAGAADVRLSLESPLLWLRADPQMEYIAEIHLNQPEQMWINQLEKDRDVVGQLQAIAAMVSLLRPTFAISTALNNTLMDSKVFCRVRVEAACALATTATEATSWVGLSHLIKFYKSRRCDPDIGLPKSNDFHDLAEYIVLEAIPGAIAAVRGSDGKSPVEATDFILHILKHNDNSSNQYSDVFWLASLIESIGGFEFGRQNMQTFSKFLKQIDRFLQYDRLMPSYNGVLTISCIHTLTRLALKFSRVMPLDRLEQLLRPFGDADNTIWQVRVTALQSILELQTRSQGLDSALKLALHLVETDPSLKVQSKLMEHMIEMIILKDEPNALPSSRTLEALVDKLETMDSFPNVHLRHHLFSLSQILAGRSASLYRRAEAVVLEIPEPQKTSPDNAQPKEVKTKITPVKVKVQQPHTEPLRIRVVPVRPVVPKEEHVVANVNLGGKEPIKAALRVGKVKLRFRPTSNEVGGTSPLELSMGSFDKGIAAASQSPASVQVSAKAEQIAAEESSQSHHGRKKVFEQLVKEERTTPVVMEDGEIESADDNVFAKEGVQTPESEGPSRFAHDILDGFGIESSKGSPVDGLHDASDKDGAESLSQVTERPKMKRHENGKAGVYNGSLQPPWDLNETEPSNLAEIVAGTSDVSDSKPVEFLSTTVIGQDLDLKQKKDKKDKDKKHKKEKRKHHREKNDDTGSQDKKRAKENDIEYQERKRKRKEDKKREKEGRKSQKLDVNIKRPIRVEENAVVPGTIKREAGDSSQRIRLKIKTIHTIPPQA